MFALQVYYNVPERIEHHHSNHTPQNVSQKMQTRPDIPGDFPAFFVSELRACAPEPEAFPDPLRIQDPRRSASNGFTTREGIQ